MRNPQVEKKDSKVLGNTSILNKEVDVLIIGSGAGGSAAAEMLTRNDKTVLVLEAGSNYFDQLDNPDFSQMKTAFSNDEIKITRRFFAQPDPLVDPRTYRSDESKVREFVGDVNHLAKTVGGGSVPAAMKTPRFQEQDFEMRTRLGGEVPGTSFADWPVKYRELADFYYHMEVMLGVQGEYDPSRPFEADRFGRAFPMKPGVPMYVGQLGSEALKKLNYNPFPYPSAINSRNYDGRPACVDCGFCSMYGCPSSAKGSSAVTALRKALLTNNCLLLAERKVIRLLKEGTADKITGVLVIEPDGRQEIYRAGQYIMAASPIEDARLLFLSDPGGPGIGNSSGMVGRNLTFHFQTYAIGIFKQRLHTNRGRSVTHGFMDFRGTAEDYAKNGTPMGGIVEIGGEGHPVDEAVNYAVRIGLINSSGMKDYMQESPLRERLMALIMQGEDAPQYSNRVDLDPHYKDLDGLPVARITYKNHQFELKAREYYSKKLIEVLRHCEGNTHGFIAPKDTPTQSKHIMGTLRFGEDPQLSVCDPTGKFHDLENLYAVDGSLFPTSSGSNPTLTIMALASYVAACMVKGRNQAKEALPNYAANAPLQ